MSSSPTGRRNTDSAPACSRLMSSRLSTRWASRSSDSSAVASSSSRSSWLHCTSCERRLVTAALAEASGVRRSWLTAASSAVRIRSASAMGRAASASAASRCCSSATAAWAANAPSTRRSVGGQRAAAQRQHQGLADRHLRVARRTAGDRRLAGRCASGVPAGRRRRAAGRAGNGPALQQRDRFHAERLADPVEQGLQRPLAPQHVARGGDQQSRTRRWPGPPAGSAGPRGPPPS